MKKKYLSIKVVGHESIAAFKNEERTGDQPHFKGDGVAVWVNEYEAKPKSDAEKKEFTEELLGDL